MDATWASFWGSALGGGLITGLSAWLIHINTGRRERRSWSRDLRLKAFSEAAGVMARGKASLRALQKALDAKDWDAFDAGRDPLANFELGPGLFDVVAIREVATSFGAWQHAARVCLLLLLQERIRRHSAARAVELGKLEEDQNEWVASDLQIMSAMQDVEERRRLAIVAIRSNLGLTRLLEDSTVAADDDRELLRKNPRTWLKIKREQRAKKKAKNK